MRLVKNAEKDAMIFDDCSTNNDSVDTFIYKCMPTIWSIVEFNHIEKKFNHESLMEVLSVPLKTELNSYLRNFDIVAYDCYNNSDISDNEDLFNFVFQESNGKESDRQSCFDIDSVEDYNCAENFEQASKINLKTHLKKITLQVRFEDSASDLLTKFYIACRKNMASEQFIQDHGQKNDFIISPDSLDNISNLAISFSKLQLQEVVSVEHVCVAILIYTTSLKMKCGYNILTVYTDVTIENLFYCERLSVEEFDGDVNINNSMYKNAKRNYFKRVLDLQNGIMMFCHKTNTDGLPMIDYYRQM